MHIVQVIPELEQGGVERGVVELNRELVKRGLRSSVISGGGRLVGQVEEDGGRHLVADVCSKNPLTVPWRVRRLRRLLSELAPDVVHARSRVPAWLCRFANRGGKWPVVTTVHGYNSVSWYSRVMTGGNRVICVSEGIKRYVQQHYGTPEAVIRVIHRGVDLAAFDPERVDPRGVERLRTAHDLNGRFVVTSVGRITELKDYETLIRAAALCVEMADLRVMIVGGVREDKRALFAQLQRLVTELGLGEVVRFAGSHDRMAEVYAASDLVVSCSKKPESFGRTLVEAMALGTPVAATRHGGALEIVREGVNGFLFAKQNPEALAEVLRRARSVTFGDVRKSVAERFSLERMVDAVCAVYDEVAGDRPG